MPIPSGQPMFRQVITLANRTACFSASCCSAAKSSAVPSLCVSGCRNVTGWSASAITSRRQVSRVSPDLTLLFVRQRMRHGIAARDVLELLLRRQIAGKAVELLVAPGAGVSPRQPAGPQPARRQTGRTQLEKVAPRDFGMFEQKVAGHLHGGNAGLESRATVVASWHFRSPYSGLPMSGLPIATGPCPPRNLLLPRPARPNNCLVPRRLRS